MTGAASALTAIATSYRFRRLLEVALKALVSDFDLDDLWLGLGRIPRGLAHREARSPRVGEAASTSQVPILRRQIAGGQTAVLEANESRTLRVAPDLARNEEHLLIAQLRRGSTQRLVVDLATSQGDEKSDVGPSLPSGPGASDHRLILTDTTCLDDLRSGYGWFFGSANENLVLRYAQLVRQISSHLGCSEVVVRGNGRTAIPAVLLASFLRMGTALITDPEAGAGESDEEQFDHLVVSHARDASRSEFVDTHAYRLRMREVLEAAPPDMRLILTRDSLEEDAGYALVKADQRSVVVDHADDWLKASV